MFAKKINKNIDVELMKGELQQSLPTYEIRVRGRNVRFYSSVEEFAASLEGVALDRAQTFYDEGIRSVADFANWTEKELLALKGIGPATIKKLKELGVKFK